MKTLPEDFKLNILNHFPEHGNDILMSLEDGFINYSVLFNPLKIPAHIKGQAIPWNANGILLLDKQEYTMDPLYHAGCYYSQEASSMVIANLAETLVPKNAFILDLCAAPGGKTLNLLNYATEGVVLANEINPKRNSILRENVIKWGSSNIIISQNTPNEVSQLEGVFDLVLIDAPCSGEGMFRKDEFAKEQWTPRLVQSCAKTQKEIIIEGIKCVKKGGVLIYSTCTLNELENEKNCEHILEKGFQEIDMTFPDEWNINKAENGYYFLPHNSLGEPLFFACFKSNNQSMNSKNKSNLKQNELTFEIDNIEKTLSTYPIGKGEYFMNENVKSLYSVVANVLRIKKVGIQVAVKDRDIIKPSLELALSAELAVENEGIRLTRDQALKYLRGEAITHIKKGWHTVSYENIKLGIVKGTGARLNNHYPKNWRIKKRF